MKPSPPSSVRCGRCHAAFLSPTDEATALIECPHCGQVQLLSDALVSSAPAPFYRTAWFKTFAGLALGTGLVLGGFNWLVQRWRPGPAEGESVEAVAEPARRTPEERAAIDAAFVTARRALASPTLAEALPFLHNAEFLVPLMERYHARHPWVPVPLERCLDAEVSARGHRRWVHLRVESAERRVFTIHVVEHPGEWKLNWEALVDAPRFEWDEFLEQQPVEDRPLRVSVLKGSVPDHYFNSLGLSVDDVMAVRFYGNDPAASVIALVGKDSPEGRLFQDELSWEHPRRYVCALKFADAKAVPPRVTLVHLLRSGWEE